MKIKFEVDITPEEVLELFEGNTENLQKAMIAYFMKAIPATKATEQDVFKFWQSMAEKSTEMFNTFQHTQNKKDSKK